MTTWVKVFNSMPGHGKFLLAGDRAGWLFVCGLCYSNEHLTNGFIARHALPAVAPGVKSPETVAAQLVAAGLWHEVEGGWQIHDYNEHQRSADEIRERRDRDRERKANGRRPDSSGSPRGQVADSHTDNSRTPHGQAEESSRVRDRAASPEGRRQKAEGRQVKTSAALRADVVECFTYWQDRCGHPQAKLTADREAKIKARLREGYSVQEIRQAINGAARGAFVNDAGKRFDDIELICRKGSKLEDFMGRAAERAGNVVPIERPKTLRQADAWQAGYPEESAS